MTNPADELRDRMGGYVATLLPVHPDIVRTGWPCSVFWRELAIGAMLTRGELVIKIERTVRQWWMPQTKSQASVWVEQLAGVLGKIHSQYASADETGRMRERAWRGAQGRIGWGCFEGDQPVTLVLEPGVRRSAGSSFRNVDRLARLGEDVTLTLGDAVEQGWVRVEG